jgi:alkylhydroperoxidase/carboxymuconolactone decarboxylase family protein YurZ
MTEEEYSALAEEIATESDRETWESRETLRGIGRELNAIALLSSLETDSVLRDHG